MTLKKLPYEQCIKDQTCVNNEYKDCTSGLSAYQFPWMYRCRYSENTLLLQDSKRDHPVYELAAIDFDKWCAVYSSHVTIPRKTGYSQYIALDGTKTRISGVNETDAMRRGMAYAIDPQKLIDAEGQDLICLDDEGAKSVLLDDKAFQTRVGHAKYRASQLRSGYAEIATIEEALPIDTPQTAFLVLRIWENCFSRMWDMYGGSNGPGNVKYDLQIAVRNFGDDPIRDCVEVFTEWLGRMLPPQVMSMICVTVCARLNDPTWENSACRILLDAGDRGIAKRENLFILDLSDNGAPQKVELWDDIESIAQPWERKLMQLLIEGKYPHFYALLRDRLRECELRGTNAAEVGIQNVAILADYNILSWCCRIEEDLLDAQENKSYEKYTDANSYLTELSQRLSDFYHVSTADIHMLLAEAEDMLLKTAQLFTGTLQYPEYMDLLAIYMDVKDTGSELARRTFDILKAQYQANDLVTRAYIQLTDDPYVKKLPELYGALKLAMTDAYLIKYKGELTFDEIIYFAGFYAEEEDTDSELAKKIIDLVSDQYAVDGKKLADEELIKSLPTLRAAFLDAELLRDAVPEMLDHEAFERWCEEYKTLEREDRKATVDKLTERLSERLHFDADDPGDTPLQIAERRGLDRVTEKMVPNLVNDYYSRCRGNLACAQYRELLDLREEYPRFLDEQLNERLCELVTGQYKFFDTEDATPEKLLREKGMSDLWNKCVFGECDEIIDEKQPLSEKEFADWLERLNYDAAEKETREKVSDMMCRRCADEDLYKNIEIVRGKGIDILEAKLVRQGCAEVFKHNCTVSRTEYEWWLNVLDKACTDYKNYADDVYKMLSQSHIREKEADQLVITKEHRCYKLLGDLAMRDVEHVSHLSTESYRRWLDICKCLQQNSWALSEGALDACERLLSRQISFETMDLLVEFGIHGNLYFGALRTLLEQQQSFGGIMQIERYRQWLSYLKVAGDERNPIAEEIRNMLGRQYKVRKEDGETLSAIEAIDENAYEDHALRVELIRTEYKHELELGIIQTPETLEKWVKHYNFIKRWAEEDIEMIQAIADKLCQHAVIANQLVFGTIIIKCGCSELEERILEAEKSISRTYTKVEFNERLSRYFSNRYSDLYKELLLQPNKGTGSEKLEYFIDYCQDRKLKASDEVNVRALLEELLGSGSVGRRTIERLNAMATNDDTIRRIFKGEKELVKGLVRTGLEEGMGVHDISGLAGLLEDSDLDVLNTRYIRDFADALVSGCDYDPQDMIAHFGTLRESTEKEIIEAVEMRINRHTPNADTLERAIDMLRSVSVSDASSIRILRSILQKCTGPLKIVPIESFLSGVTDGNPRADFLHEICNWIRRTPNQPQGTADALLPFAAKLSAEELKKPGDELYAALGIMMTNAQAAIVEPETYERAVELWQDKQSDFDAQLRIPMLDASDALVRRREDFVRRCMETGPVRIDERYATLAKCALHMQCKALQDILRSSDTIAVASEKLGAPEWIDAAALDACYGADPAVPELLRGIVKKEFEATCNGLRANGAKTAVLDALSDLEDRARRADTKIRQTLESMVLALVREQSVVAFKECVALFSADNKIEGQFRSACDKLKSLFMDAHIDSTSEISADTLSWCEQYASVVWQDRSDGADFVRSIHPNRKDLGMLALFVKRVYDQVLSRRDMVNAPALLAAAKVLRIGDIWTKYLQLAMHYPEGTDGIWASGKDNAVIQNVIYLYNRLKDIDDDIATQNSLSDYCVGDARFSELADKLHNRELQTILKRSGKTADRGRTGFFGKLFGK